MEDALIAPNGTPYLASMAQQINNTNTELISLKTELKNDMSKLTEAVESIQASSGGGGQSSVVPEGAVQVVVSYTPAHAAYFTLRYKLNGKDYIALPTSQEASVSVFVDKNSNLGIQSTNGVSTKWVISDDGSFTSHPDDETFVNSTAGENLTDLVHIPVGEIDGGFTVSFATGTMSLTKAYRGLYKVSAKKVATSGTTTIHFDVNGGAGTPPEDVIVYTGSTHTLPMSPDLTKSGYTFAGWSTDPNAGVEEIDAKENHYNLPLKNYVERQESIDTAESSYVLYAIWTNKAALRLSAGGYYTGTNQITLNGVVMVRAYNGGNSVYVGIKAGDIIGVHNGVAKHTVTSSEITGGGYGSINDTYSRNMNASGSPWFYSTSTSGIAKDWVFSE